MQKRVIGLLILIFVIIFLSYGVFAVAVGSSECKVLARSDCGNDANEKIVMGLSAATNAHGQDATWASKTPAEGGYTYVLCCGFGDGVQTNECDDTKNKIIGLSAPTNAHAEIPSLSNYGTKVCYENLVCVGASSCQAGEKNILNLSAETNAHIGGDYPTKICCSMPESPILTCSLTKSFWSKNGTNPIIQGDESVMEGTQVKLVVKGTNCGSVSVSFEVREGGAISQGSATPPDNTTFNGGKATGTWVTEFMSTILDPNPEYYFIASVIGNPSESVTSDFDLMLEVTQDPGWCTTNSIYTCDDYPNELTCSSDSSSEKDLCNVTEASAPSGVDCNDPLANCDCSWNSVSSTCEFTSTSGAVCGNNVIDAGEHCDGTEWGQFTSNSCNKFGFKEGGTLACVECKFNTANCIDGFGSCGDGTIHKGETCDGNLPWGQITGCEDFNAFNNTGTLSCDGICQINTSLCVGGSGWDITKSSGMCRYSTSADDRCDDGSLTYLATWIDDESEKPSSCESRVIQCPPQIQLPFFNKYSLIATIILIAVIYYIMLILRKKKLMKKRIRRAGSRKRKRKR